MEMKIPYFKQPDGTHCFQACLKMILKYLFPEKDFTYEELDKISDKPKDKRTWTCAAVVNLNNMKLKIKHYSKFDYSEFVKNGANYIREIYEKEIAEKIIKYSDVESEIENAKKMLEKDIFKIREISFEDVEKWFKENFLMIFLINSEVINKRPEYIGHYIVLTGFDNENVYIHDPDYEDGSPNRKVEKSLFIKAWKYPKEENDIVLIKNL